MTEKHGTTDTSRIVFIARISLTNYKTFGFVFPLVSFQACSQCCEKRLIDLSCVSVLLPAWNNLALIGQIFVTCCGFPLKSVETIYI